MTPVDANGKTCVPPLEHGDRLSRAEFERRYEAMPHVNKAELIEGVVYMPSPVRHQHHRGPYQDFGVYSGIYRHFTPGTDEGKCSSVRMDLQNELQPDVVLFIAGGNAWIDGDDFINGSPELIAELSTNSDTLDLGPKLEVYKRNGVKEYVVWRTEGQVIDWFILRNDQYEPLTPVDGIIKSETFPGLWIDCAALLRGDHARVHEVLRQGLQSPEHAAFVDQLKKTAQGPDLDVQRTTGSHSCLS